jgi:hypothetical protein
MTEKGIDGRDAEADILRVGQTNQELLHLRTHTFLVTYLVKLPPSRLLGCRRDAFVARCGRTMT